jgi:hypothetical protein
LPLFDKSINAFEGIFGGAQSGYHFAIENKPLAKGYIDHLVVELFSHLDGQGAFGDQLFSKGEGFFFQLF